jgi:hypothetical protein
MSKRSSFARRKNDAYDTPKAGVQPLLPFLTAQTRFVEPCAGNGSLVDRLTDAGHYCVLSCDVEPRREDVDIIDALSDIFRKRANQLAFDCVVTNPPWSRHLLHPMIEIFTDIAPTWLLFDADWLFTKQAAPYMRLLSKVVATPRLKWIEGSKYTSKDNTAWFLFDKQRPVEAMPQFYGRCL